MQRINTLVTAFLSATSFAALAQAPLPALNLDPQITVSGLSSGAYMAGQFHQAHAEQIKGVALLAGGPVYCAQNSLGLALEHCFNKETSAPDLKTIDDYLQSTRSAGELAPLSALQNDKVWILNGTKDATVYPKLGQLLSTQYRQWLKPENVAFISDKPFAHTFPTDNAELGACDTSTAPFLANCQYDAAGAFLSHLLGSVKARVTAAAGTMLTVNQHQLSAAAKETLSQEGYLYVPASCAQGEPCQLHLSLHGCKQNYAAVGDAYIRNSGLNQYADSNNLVVFYPQTTASSINPFNPNACWDWWGYSGDNYATRSGKQIQALHQLTTAILGSKAQ